MVPTLLEDSKSTVSNMFCFASQIMPGITLQLILYVRENQRTSTTTTII